MKNSPCIGLCYDIDTKKALCLGCFRTLDEVATWWDKSPEERREVLKDLKHRRKGREPGRMRTLS